MMQDDLWINKNSDKHPAKKIIVRNRGRLEFNREEETGEREVEKTKSKKGMIVFIIQIKKYTKKIDK